MNFSAIIFDFNGVIIDDEPVHADLFIKVLYDEEIILTEKDYWEKYLGFDDKGLFEAIYQREGKKLTPKKLKELIEKKNHLYFPALQKKFKVFDGVSLFISEVAKKYPLAVVSGALRSEIEFVLDQLGQKNLFEFIISADDTKRGKPDPEGYVMALAKLKKSHPEIKPETCLVIEDSLSGIEAAKRANMKVVALTHSYPKNELKNADWVFDSFDEIKSLVTS